MGKVLKVPNPVKKGDFVVLQTHHNTFYINPSRSQAREDWTIVQVAAASRQGEATSIRRRADGVVTALKHIHGRPKIHTILMHQEGAAALFGRAYVWHSGAEVRRALLEKEGIGVTLEQVADGVRKEAV